jgi:hypothetical protein
MATYELRFATHHPHGLTRWVVLTWTREQRPAGMVQASVSHLDVAWNIGSDEERFWSALAVEAGREFEVLARRGEVPTTYQSEPYRVDVTPRLARCLAESADFLPALRRGEVIHAFEV